MHKYRVKKSKMNKYGLEKQSKIEYTLKEIDSLDGRYYYIVSTNENQISTLQPGHSIAPLAPQLLNICLHKTF